MYNDFIREKFEGKYNYEEFNEYQYEYLPDFLDDLETNDMDKIIDGVISWYKLIEKQYEEYINQEVED